MACANCAALRERVREMERELGLRFDHHQNRLVAKTFGINPMGALILMMLYRAKGRYVSVDRILDMTGIETVGSLRSHISKIRRTMGWAVPAIPIHPGESSGYHLTPEGLTRIAMILAEK